MYRIISNVTREKLKWDIIVVDKSIFRWSSTKHSAT